MRRIDPDPDATVVLRRPPPKAARPGWRLPAMAAAAVVLLGGGAAWLWWPRPMPVPVPATSVPATSVPATSAPAPAPSPAPQARPGPEFTLHTATEAQILDHVGTGLTVFRFAPDPHILVLDFGSLREQGAMLNRVAALTEKQGLPHDRLLTDAQLDAAIRAGGDTPSTYYYGHDYGLPELTRFFALADRQQLRLDPQERALRRLMLQLGWFAPDARGALISIPQVGANDRVTRAARAAILRHELSHGLFFSDPAYAAFVRRFWTESLTPTERANFRRFLAADEYDTSLDALMINEMQAYLMFTRDPEFFSPDRIGMTPARLLQLQRQFAAGMPHGWLRRILLSTLPGDHQ